MSNIHHLGVDKTTLKLLAFSSLTTALIAYRDSVLTQLYKVLEVNLITFSAIVASNLILFLTATGNLAGNIFLNAYILNGAGLLTFVGIWYIEWGRRNALASAFLGTSAISVLVVVLEKSGKCDKCGIRPVTYILGHKAYTIVYLKVAIHTLSFLSLPGLQVLDLNDLK